MFKIKIYPDDEDARKRTIFMILAFSFLLIFTLVGFLGFEYIEQKNLVKHYQVELISTKALNKELEKEIKEFEIRMEVYEHMVDTKDSTLIAIQSVIGEKIKKIKELLRKGNITRIQFEEAKKELNEMHDYTNKYQKQIAELTKQNILLANENADLKNNLSDKDKEISRIESEQEILANKVSLGSKLVTNQLNVIGILAKGKGKEKKTMKGSKMGWLKISFTLNKNILAEKEPRDFFVVILGNNGFQLIDNKPGSFVYKGKERYYTVKENLEFTNNPSKVYDIYWIKGSSFEKGAYKVELYCKNYLVGEKSFIIK